MHTTHEARRAEAVAALELKTIGEAIFAEWFPNHLPGDPVPPDPPPHILREADELARKHRLIEVRRRNVRSAVVV